MRKSVLLLAALLLPALALGQDWRGPAALEVRVEDAKGRNLAGAEVLLVYLSPDGGGQLPSVLTDANGHADIGGLAAGRWSVEVRHAGQMSYRAELALSAEGKPSVVSASHVMAPGASSTMKVKFSRGRSSAGAAPVPRSESAAMPPMAPVTPVAPVAPVTPPSPAPKAPILEPAPVPAAPPVAVREPAPVPEARPVSKPAPPATPPAPPVSAAPGVAVAEKPPVKVVPPIAATPAPAPVPASPKAVAPSPAPPVPAPEKAPAREVPPVPAMPPPVAPVVPPAPAKAPVKEVPAAPAVPPTAAPVVAPDPPKAPVKEVPAAPPVPSPTAPAKAPAPVVQPPVVQAQPAPQTAPPVAPLPTRTLPSSTPVAEAPVAPRARLCVECPPGESASWGEAAIEGGATAGCPTDLAARLKDIDLDGVATLSSEFAAGGAGCRVIAVELPAGARFTGFRYEAQSAGLSADCLPGRGCPAGGCRFPNEPVLRQDGKRTVLLVTFESTAPDLRRAVVAGYSTYSKR